MNHNKIFLPQAVSVRNHSHSYTRDNLASKHYHLLVISQWANQGLLVKAVNTQQVLGVNTAHPTSEMLSTLMGNASQENKLLRGKPT